MEVFNCLRRHRLLLEVSSPTARFVPVSASDLSVACDCIRATNMRALIFYTILKATSATRIATIPPPKNTSSLPDYVGCVEKSPELSLAIWNFCNQPNLTVPSAFASRFDYGNITMGIEASCKPSKVLQESTCRDRFFRMCNGSSEDTIKILKTFGNNGCQDWIIHRGAAVNGTTPRANATASSTSMSTTTSVHETKGSSTSMSTASSTHETSGASKSTSTPSSVHKTTDTPTSMSTSSSVPETTNSIRSVHGSTSTSVPPETTSTSVNEDTTASTHERKITGRPSHDRSSHEHTPISVRGKSMYRQSASARPIHSHSRQL